tara:strand:- start:59268 stop:59804 length:537 start_codon:yes stop_codon:yes gene_type:complete
MKKLCFFILLLISLNSFSQSRNDIRKSGDILQIILPASAALSTFIWNDDSKPTWQFVKAFSVSFATTQAFKRIINKSRPDGGVHAFPSGHTSASFTGAAFLERRFGWKIGIPAYILASYVGWSRIYSKKHDGWDVFAGAIVGIGSSYLFAKPYQEKKLNVAFQKVKTGGYLISMKYTF